MRGEGKELDEQSGEKTLGCACSDYLCCRVRGSCQLFLLSMRIHALTYSRCTFRQADGISLVCDKHLSLICRRSFTSRLTGLGASTARQRLVLVLVTAISYLYHAVNYALILRSLLLYGWLLLC